MEGVSSFPRICGLECFCLAIRVSVSGCWTLQFEILSYRENIASHDFARLQAKLSMGFMLLKLSLARFNEVAALEATTEARASEEAAWHDSHVRT